MTFVARLTTFALLGGLLLVGCSTTPPEQTPLMRTVPDYEASSSKTRTLIRTFAQRFAQIVEGAADEAYYSTDDLEVRSALLMWKSRVVPLSQGTCYLQDPLAALIDTWALAVQQRQYVESDWMRAQFGPAWEAVREAARAIESEVEAIAAKTMKDGDISGGREFVQAWAAENPIDLLWVTRKTMVADRGEVSMVEGLGAMARMALLTEEMNDLTRRLSLYGEFMPRQARWQAEIMANDLGLWELAHAANEGLPELLPLARAAAETLAELPALVYRERVALVEVIEAERAAAFDFLTSARLELQAWLDSQLAVSMAHVTAERVAAVEALRDQVQVITDQATAERSAAVEGLGELVQAQWPVVREELPAVGSAAVEQSVTTLEDVVDHAFVRLAQVIGAALVLVFIGALILIVVAKR